MSTRREGLAFQRKRRGFSQESLAETLHVSRSTVRRWETGLIEPTPKNRITLVEVLEVSERELDALIRNESYPNLDDTGHNNSDHTIQVKAKDEKGNQILVDVTRRDFIKGLGAATLASSTPTLRQPNLETSVRKKISATGAPVEHFQRMRRVLIDSDNLYGSRTVLPLVYDQIQILGKEIPALTGTDRHKAINEQAYFSEFSAWLNQDLGDFSQAKIWTERALELSHMAMDSDLTSCVLARKSQLAGDMNDPQGAIDFAEAAEFAARGNNRLIAVAKTYAGHGHALAGDRTQSERSYESAYELLDSQPATSSWGAWLDTSYISAHRGASLVTLNDFESANPEFEIAIDSLGENYKRDRSVYLARAARAKAGFGDIDGSISLATEALSVSVESGRLDTELSHLLTNYRNVNTQDTRDFMDLVESFRSN